MTDIAELTGVAQGNVVAAARRADAHSQSRMAALLARAYRFRALRRSVLAFVKRLEGGEMHSLTLRRVMKEFHGVDIGCYSYGTCFVPGAFPPKTSVGRYCSIAEGVRIYRRNHPIKYLSQHPLFYNREVGLVMKDTIGKIEANPLSIGNDVWIGSGVTILPGCRQIGDGAIVGAGSVVSRDIPAFSIYVGNPARFVRERYSPDIRVLIERSRWWDLPLDELLVAAGELLYRPINHDDAEEFATRLQALVAAA